MLISRILVLVALAMFSALALTPTAGAAEKYRNCSGKQYLLLHGDDPAVEQLRIKMRNAKADGYAPRCLVAEAVAGDVQDEARRTGKRLKKLNVYGAAWTVGTFRCTYAAKTGY